VTPRFFARRADDELVDAASLTDCHNPFLVAAYMRAQRALALDCWLFGIENGDAISAAALGVLRRGRILSSVDIPSAPCVEANSIFWNGLDAFCRRRRITDLAISTFASPHAAIPVLRGEEARMRRTEFEWRLDGKDLFADLSRHHRARVGKARNRGMTLRRSASDEALDAHMALRAHSMSRRKARNEEVPLEFSRADDAVLLGTGAGELYQAVLQGQVVSTLLIMRSTRGAYFQSAGTSADGMRLGASHFLVLESALALQAEGIEVYFLGGAREHEEGLRAYKSGFGSTPVESEAVIAYLGGPFRRRVSAAVDSIQRAITPRSNAAVLAPNPDLRMRVGSVEESLQVRTASVPCITFA
jgi:Acetyltransferase (GNAT) domain